MLSLILIGGGLLIMMGNTTARIAVTYIHWKTRFQTPLLRTGSISLCFVREN